MSEETIHRSTGDEEYYCWCAARLAYLPRMNSWCCDDHGLATIVYWPKPDPPKTSKP
jgi:hypothetical protein